MKFFEEKISQVLDDLEVPHQSVISSSGGVAVELDTALPVEDFLAKVRQDPRYNFRLEVGPAGYFLEFKNTNVPSLRALVDIYLSVRVDNGRISALRGSFKSGRVFPADGVPRKVWSLQELDLVSREAREEESIEDEVSTLG